MNPWFLFIISLDDYPIEYFFIEDGVYSYAVIFESHFCGDFVPNLAKKGVKLKLNEVKQTLALPKTSVIPDHYRSVF